MDKYDEKADAMFRPSYPLPGPQAIAQALRESAAEAEEPFIAELSAAGKALKFCAQWGGRSGRIPGNGPGTKTHHAKEAFKRLKQFLFAAALASPPSPAPVESKPKPCGRHIGFDHPGCVECAADTAKPSPEAR